MKTTVKQNRILNDPRDPFELNRRVCDARLSGFSVDVMGIASGQLGVEFRLE